MSIVALLLAVVAPTALGDPAVEARADALEMEIRCVQCQNEPIAQSTADIANDMRALVRERIAAGDSDSQVIDFLVARYGEFVLLKPRFSAHTLLLWLAPFAAVVIGGWGLVIFLRRRANEPGTAQEQLTPAEQARVVELLKESGQG